MGNTPSAQHSPSRQSNGASPELAQGQGKEQTTEQGRRSEDQQPSSSSASTSGAAAAGPSRQPNLRLPMPTRPHTSPQSSNPASPSGRPGSPRRRKSLELPDLNKLSFTPTAAPPVLSLDSSGHPGLPIKSKRPGASTATEPLSSSIPVPGAGQKRWQQVLGGRTASPLVGQNALSAMSRLDGTPAASASVPSPPTAVQVGSSPARTHESSNNPYFPSTQAQESAQRAAAGSAALPVSIPIPIPLGKGTERRVDVRPADGSVSTPPSRTDPSPAGRADAGAASDVPGSAAPVAEGDGLVNVPIQWVGGGREVFVAGNFANKWNDRVKLKKSTHDFNTILRLPPGQYKLKFIVDESWLCSKQLPTATDDDGTLVNWIEVEAPKTEEQLKAEWALDTSPERNEENDDSQWTNAIPVPLVLYQYIEELPLVMSEAEFDGFVRTAPHLSRVPSPPVLPRILDKVILNADSNKARLRPEDQVSTAGSGSLGATNMAPPPAGLDDNSILAVPNHVVLNHLTASAIKNGTLGVGTTTRYRKKYITTMFFKPTDSDKPPEPPTAVPVEVPAA